jgi:peptidoglycan/xylan/chitin deacetylase (PgdA/CDA1 family)
VEADPLGAPIVTIEFKRAIKAGMGRLAGLTGAYRLSFRSKMVIIAFHRINDVLPGDGLTCSAAKFDAFCAFFREHFRVVSLREQVIASRNGIDMGGTLSITFDDGYRDNFEVAAPILRRYGLPATFFITTDFVDSDRVPAWDHHLPLQPGWMTWDHVRGLAQQGFEIGCHTATHINMGISDPETVRAELELSKQKLQQELGKSIDLFAYPFGGPDQISERSLQLVREAGFVSCLGCHGGVNSAIADPYRLNRIGIANWYATPHQFGIELLMGKA